MSVKGTDKSTAWLLSFWENNNTGEIFKTNVRQALQTAEQGHGFNFFDREHETLRNACTEVASEVCNLGSLNFGRIDALFYSDRLYDPHDRVKDLATNHASLTS